MFAQFLGFEAQELCCLPPPRLPFDAMAAPSRCLFGEPDQKSLHNTNPAECGGKAGVLEFPSGSRAQFCNLSSAQLDLQRPKSAVCVCVRASAHVDIWFKESPPSPWAAVAPSPGPTFCPRLLFS